LVNWIGELVNWGAPETFAEHQGEHDAQEAAVGTGQADESAPGGGRDQLLAPKVVNRGDRSEKKQ
jgi:hypothetical protein